MLKPPSKENPERGFYSISIAYGIALPQLKRNVLNLRIYLFCRTTYYLLNIVVERSFP
jgi:hypothetical protein